MTLDAMLDELAAFRYSVRVLSDVRAALTYDPARDTRLMAYIDAVRHAPRFDFIDQSHFDNGSGRTYAPPGSY